MTLADSIAAHEGTLTDPAKNVRAAKHSVDTMDGRRYITNINSAPQAGRTTKGKKMNTTEIKTILEKHNVSANLRETEPDDDCTGLVGEVAPDSWARLDAAVRALRAAGCEVSTSMNDDRTKRWLWIA